VTALLDTKLPEPDNADEVPPFSRATLTLKVPSPATLPIDITSVTLRVPLLAESVQLVLTPVAAPKKVPEIS